MKFKESIIEMIYLCEINPFLKCAIIVSEKEEKELIDKFILEYKENNQNFQERLRFNTRTELIFNNGSVMKIICITGSGFKGTRFNKILCARNVPQDVIDVVIKPMITPYFFHKPVQIMDVKDDE